MLKAKRVYDPPLASDGFRVLVDRLWPRGLSKETAQVDLWMREIAPSTALRAWFAHDPDKWPAFAVRYRAELASRQAHLDELLRRARGGGVTLLYSARDKERNNAVVLLEYLEERLLG